MRSSLLLLFTLLLLSSSVAGQVIKLSGGWKFHINDNASWALPKFDDSTWKSIYAPAPWEDEGFNGYDGFAWYRRRFNGKLLDKAEGYYLNLGFIDDCDEVFVNGKLIGFSGSMPPKFKTAYNNERHYSLPEDVINYDGENVIAIRVFDTTHEGGIIDGDLGVFRIYRNKNLLIDLHGIWSFTLSETPDRVKKESEWLKLMVPALWEHQGFPRYDGYAWYKRTFTIPANFTKEPIVLMLGKIDDFDKTYFNGVLIGTTNDNRPFGNSFSYQKERVYTIPPELIKRGAANTIEVLVEDMGHNGGMYEGTVGITTKTNYEKYFLHNRQD